mgnify:CR=1 FL=1
MKLYKRFAAALLAGIMVLALFTACNGTPQSPEEQKKVDAACTIWQDKARAAVNKNLPRNAQLRKAAQEMGEELAAKGELVTTDGTYWGRLRDVQVPAGMEADFMVLTWDKKTPVTYKLDKLLDDAGDPDWAKDAYRKVYEMMLHVLAAEERLEKVEEADVAAIKNKDGTYSFVLGYIIAE